MGEHGHQNLIGIGVNYLHAFTFFVLARRCEYWKSVSKNFYYPVEWLPCFYSLIVHCPLVLK